MESLFEDGVALQYKTKEQAEHFERLAIEVACADRRKLLAAMQDGPITAVRYRSLLDRLHEVSHSDQISHIFKLNHHVWEIAVGILEKVLSRGLPSEGSLTLLIGTALLIAFKVNFLDLVRRRGTSEPDLFRRTFCNQTHA